MKTPIQELINTLVDLKENKCKTLQEVLFIDGILAVIDGNKFLEKEQNVMAGLIKNAKDPKNKAKKAVKILEDYFK